MTVKARVSTKVDGSFITAGRIIDIDPKAFNESIFEKVIEAKADQGGDEPTKDELKAEADSLGITYAPNISAPKLQALIDKAKADQGGDE